MHNIKTISMNDAYYLLGHTRALTRDRDQLAAMIANAAPLCRNTRANDNDKLADMINAVAPYYNKVDLRRAMVHDGGHMVWYALRGQKIAVDDTIPDTLIQRPHAAAYHARSAFERFIDDIFVPVNNLSYQTAGEEMQIRQFIDSGRDIAARAMTRALPLVRPVA